MEVKQELITPHGSVDEQKVMEWIRDYMKPKLSKDNKEKTT